MCIRREGSYWPFSDESALKAKVAQNQYRPRPISSLSCLKHSRPSLAVKIQTIYGPFIQAGAEKNPPDKKQILSTCMMCLPKKIRNYTEEICYSVYRFWQNILVSLKLCLFKYCTSYFQLCKLCSLLKGNFLIGLPM